MEYFFINSVFYNIKIQIYQTEPNVSYNNHNNNHFDIKKITLIFECDKIKELNGF